LSETSICSRVSSRTIKSAHVMTHTKLS
jgi:hypothetical protein